MTKMETSVVRTALLQSTNTTRRWEMRVFLDDRRLYEKKHSYGNPAAEGHFMHSGESVIVNETSIPPRRI